MRRLTLALLVLLGACREPEIVCGYELDRDLAAGYPIDVQRVVDDWAEWFGPVNRYCREHVPVLLYKPGPIWCGAQKPNTVYRGCYRFDIYGCNTITVLDEASDDLCVYVHELAHYLERCMESEGWTQFKPSHSAPKIWDKDTGFVSVVCEGEDLSLDTCGGEDHE